MNLKNLNPENIKKWFSEKKNLILQNEKIRKWIPSDKNLKLIGVAVILLVVASFVSSQITGYVTYSQQNLNETLEKLDTCESDLITTATENTELKTSVEGCTAEKNKLSSQVSEQSTTIRVRDSFISECQEDLLDVTGQLTSTQIEVTSIKNQLNATTETLEEHDVELIECITGYEQVTEHYANRYCCILNVLGSSYNTYEVIKDDVVCLEDSGTRELSC